MKHLFTLNARFAAVAIAVIVLAGAPNTAFAKPKTDAATTGIANPTGTNVCATTYAVSVNIKNNGTDTLKTVKINWTISGVPQTTYSFSGKIKTDSTKAINIGSYTFTTAGTAKLKVWTSSPNGKVDSFPTNDTFSVALTVNSLPLVITGGPQLICEGDSILIGNLGSGNDSYSWTSHPAGFKSSNPSPTVMPKVSSEFILTVTDNNTGCSATDSVQINVNPAPAAKVSSPVTICAGNSANIGAAAVTGSTYSWFTDPPGYTSTSSNPTVNPYTTTTYFLVETGASGCTAKDSVLITVNPQPGAYAGIDQRICAGQSTTIGGSFNNPDDDYTWSSIPNGYSSNLPNPTVTPTGSITYILTETVKATGCSNTNSVVVTIVPLPNATKTSGATEVCLGGSNIYVPSPDIGQFYTFRLDKDAVSAGATFLQSNDTAYISWGTPGKVNLWLTTMNISGCSDSSKLVITANVPPTAKFSADHACQGFANTFTNTSTGNDSNIWIFGDGDTLKALSPTHVYAKAGTYTTILRVASNAGCSNKTSGKVTVDSLPTVSFSVPKFSCIGSSLSFGNTSTGTDLSYVWSFGDGSKASTAKSPNYTYTGSGTFQASLKCTNASGCSDSASKDITIVPLPVIDFGAKQGMARNFDFHAKDSLYNSYHWDFGDTTSGSGAKTTHSYGHDGTFVIKLSATDSFGCVGFVDSAINVILNGISKTNIPGFDYSVYPNPFSEKTTLSYSLPFAGMVTITVTDITGHQIAELVHAHIATGKHEYEVGASALALKPGFYFINIAFERSSLSKKILKME